jgi:hypothetical protein
MTAPDNRSSRISIRLTEVERSKLTSAAEKNYLSESAYVRNMLRGEITQVVLPEIGRDTLQELARLRIELTRQGVNLNQLVKLVHSDRQPSTEQIVNRLDSLIEIYQQLQATALDCQSQLIGGDRDDRQN